MELPIAIEPNSCCIHDYANHVPVVSISQAMLVYKSVVLLITILVFKSSYVNGSNQLHIGGIFPIAGKGGWQGGQGKGKAACTVRRLDL